MKTSIIESDRRCPRCSKRLVADIGQHDTAGDLRVRWYCLHDEYQEWSTSRPEAARKHSESVRSAAERLLSLRRGEVDLGVFVPMHYDTSEWPKEEIDV